MAPPNHTAERRAQLIVERVVGFADDEGLAPQDVRLVSEDDLTRLYAGKRLLLTVSAADARLEQLDTETLARFYRDRIVETVERYRAARTRGALLHGAWLALAVFAAVAAALLLLHWAFRRVDRWLEQRLKERIKGIHLQSLQLVHARHIWALLRAAARIVHLLIALPLLFVGLDLALRQFPWTRPLSERLLALLLEPLRAIAHALLHAVPDLVFLVVLALAVRYGLRLLRLLRLMFAAVADGRIRWSGFDRDWAQPTYRIVRMLVVAFALVVAYPYIPGSGSDAFKGITIFLGLLVSLGSTSFIANIVAGYTMSFRSAFRIGDRVRIGSATGDVVEQSVLVTRLRTPKNEEVSIPNSLVLATDVVNYSAATRAKGLIVHTSVGIGYETPWRQVEAMLLEAAARTAGVAAEPKPFVHQTGLGDFAVNYEINVGCRNAQAMAEMHSELHRHILDVFNEFGVQIMTPAYEGDPKEPKLVPQAHWFDAPAGSSPNPTG